MDLTKKHCLPCEDGAPPMLKDDENKYIKSLPSWILIREGKHKIKKLFRFKNFKDAMKFVNRVAGIAETEGHHPNIKIVYNKAELELFTHKVNGLSENDFIMAAKIDSVFKKAKTIVLL